MLLLNSPQSRVSTKRPDVADHSAAAPAKKPRPEPSVSPKKPNQGAFEVFDCDAQLGGPLDPFMSVRQLQLPLDTPALMTNV